MSRIPQKGIMTFFIYKNIDHKRLGAFVGETNPTKLSLSAWISKQSQIFCKVHNNLWLFYSPCTALPCRTCWCTWPFPWSSGSASEAPPGQKRWRRSQREEAADRWTLRIGVWLTSKWWHYGPIPPFAHVSTILLFHRLFCLTSGAPMSATQWSVEASARKKRAISVDWPQTKEIFLIPQNIISSVKPNLLSAHLDPLMGVTPMSRLKRESVSRRKTRAYFVQRPAAAE